MKMTTVGIDLAKTVFQLHGEDDHGKPVLRKKLDRSKMLAFFIQLPPCLIGMEACGSAHYWARKLTAMGHTVKRMTIVRLDFAGEEVGRQFDVTRVQSMRAPTADCRTARTELICADKPSARFGLS